MNRTQTQRRRFAGILATTTVLAMLLFTAPQTGAQAVAEGTVTSEFTSWPGPTNTLTVGGVELECFTLQFSGALPETGTVYTIGDTESALSDRNEQLIALTLGSRNHTFADGSELAIAGATGRLDVIVQLTVWAYADNYDLAVASSDERSAVVALQSAVEASADGGDTSGNPIVPASIIFAAAPNPDLAHLVVLPPQSPGEVDGTTTTADPLIPAVTATAPTTTAPTTAAPPTAPRPTAAPTTATPTTSEQTTASPTTTLASSTTTTADEIAAPASTTETTVADAATDELGPDPTVLGAVQERDQDGAFGSGSTTTLAAGAVLLTAGIAFAFVATRRARHGDA